MTGEQAACCRSNQRLPPVQLGQSQSIGPNDGSTTFEQQAPILVTLGCVVLLLMLRPALLLRRLMSTWSLKGRRWCAPLQLGAEPQAQSSRRSSSSRQVEAAAVANTWSSWRICLRKMSWAGARWGPGCRGCGCCRLRICLPPMHVCLCTNPCCAAGVTSCPLLSATVNGRSLLQPDVSSVLMCPVAPSRAGP